MPALSSARQPRQLHLVDDTALRDDARLRRAVPTASSTVSFPTASSTVDIQIKTIDQRRRDRALSHAAFCRIACIDHDNWFRLLRGEHRPSPALLVKLNAALDEAKVQAPKPPIVIAAFHRLVMSLIADRLGLDREAVLATDFSVQRPQNPAWKAASEVRLIAIYITAVELQVENPDIAAALGISRQAVKKARDRVEDLRSDADRDALIDAVAALAMGRA